MFFNNIKKNKKDARAGEFWTVNDKYGRGHKSLLTKKKKDNVDHISFTHSERTRGRKNILLEENPDKNDFKKSYMVNQLYKSKIKNLGKYQNDMKIANINDKSKIRYLKKRK